MRDIELDNASSTRERTSPNRDGANREIFERFLTYRRRMARMGAVQVLYLRDILHKVHEEHGFSRGLFGTEAHQDIDHLCCDIQYFYSNILLPHKPSISTEPKDEQRIDEKYLRDIITATIKNLKRIDETISRYLKKNWTIDGLDCVIRAILRCGVAEVLFNVKTDIPILTCEYTNITSLFFGDRETGFVNGIVDRVSKENRV